MLIVNKAPFAKGLFLMITFLIVFGVIMSPVFKDHNGNVQTGLEFSDDFFNKLSKNSSDYFDTVKAVVAKQKGVQIAVNATISKPDPKDEPDHAKAQAKANQDAQNIAKVLQTAGAQVEVKDNVLMVKADLGVITEFACNKAISVFAVTGTEAVDKPENQANRKLCKDLWKGFGAMMKALQKDRKVAEAKALDTVMRKGLEPAYNFYGLPGEPVSQNVLMLIGLLSFYVVYTMWYGFSIFFMFEGVGMSMKKSKKKG
ncbi:hypothetical protein [Fundidesulfovibrio terrae]|uniref:hypothetical protein n=1 Tax=Fundidesulfovibrio terrae TaxID=2922866 RepID=UPI001FAF8EDD|nr:hypothetical protein [Fundidesulfovibrio terrae]